MEGKKIGFEAKRALHNFRGLGNYSRRIVEGMLRYYPHNEYYLFSPTPKDARALKWLQDHPELKLVTPSGSWKLAPTLWRSVWLGKVASEYKLDLFHGLSHELPPFGLKCPQIVTIHDLIYLRYPEFFPAIDRMVYDRKFRGACERATKIVAICEQTKRDLIEFFKTPEAKIEVAYQSVDPRYGEILSDEFLASKKIKYQIERPYFFFVGALEERKNVTTLISAFASISEQVPYDLVIVGRGNAEYEKKLRSLISENNLSKRVHLLNHIPDSDLPALYQAADVMCFPSFFEGFGLPIVESLMGRTPVITSKGSCFPESGGESTWYIDPNSKTDLAQAMKILAGDEKRRDQMAKEGHEFVQKFQLSETSKRLKEIYEQTILR